MSLNLAKEKLLVYILVDDSISTMVIGTPVVACIRAFIVEDRQTKAVKGLWRMKQPNGERNWYEISPKPGTSDPVTHLRKGLETVFNSMTRLVGHPEIETVCFYPPDDEGDPGKTLKWLFKMDLMEIAGLRFNKDVPEEIKEKVRVEWGISKERWAEMQAEAEAKTK